MKRRAFLVGMAAAPLFIRRAFGDASIAAPAVRRGAPTLVLVVPRDAETRWKRGALFGRMLNEAGPVILARLALVDVVCAPASEFGARGEPYALFVDGAGVHRYDSDTVERFVREMIPLPPSASMASLVATARQRYVKHAPRGARWGNSLACGVEYEEGPPADAVDCGMAFAPEASRRFLDFYVKAS
jgi:hypothetical protein